MITSQRRGILRIWVSHFFRTTSQNVTVYNVPFITLLNILSLNEKMKFLYTVLSVLFCIALNAQTSDSLTEGYSKVAKFYKGKWYGKGAFSNGKPIEAAVSFEIDSLCQCLVYKHQDVPSGWKVLSLWNISKAEKQVKAIYNDEFSGMRIFSASEFSESRIVYSRSALRKDNSQYFERFVFEKQDSNTYKMTWETSSDGDKWRMGDWLVFRRVG